MKYKTVQKRNENMMLYRMIAVYHPLHSPKPLYFYKAATQLCRTKRLPHFYDSNESLAPKYLPTDAAYSLCGRILYVHFMQ